MFRLPRPKKILVLVFIQGKGTTGKQSKGTVIVCCQHLETDFLLIM